MANLVYSGKVIIRVLFLLMLIVLFQVFSKSQEVNATHAAGSDMTYRCLGGNQYEVEVSFYRDCAGIDAPAVITVFYRSVSCGFNQNVTATQVPNSEVEISVPCSSSASTCNNGITTGIKKFIYRAVVNLPAACSDWVFSYSICCRNCSITTIDDPCGNSSNLYVEAKLNNLIAPCNSSPAFSNNPIAFVCVGQNFSFNQGVYDADGDSLSYSLIAPKTSANTSVQYLPPATINEPIASSTPFGLNAVTGDINFTPNQIQIGILAVLVQEFRNGQLIGSVIRDIQIYSTACFNTLPVASGINGSNSYSATICPGQQLCFDIFTDDADANQTITMTSNNGIPGGTFTISGGNHPIGSFCWTPGYNDVDLLPKTFTVTVKDDNCPTNGQQTFSFSIFVPSPFFTFVTTDVTCAGGNNGSATASPVYGNLYNYSWNSVPVQNTPTASGLAAGSYTLTVSDTNSCSLSVPVVISEPSAINISSTVADVTCFGENNGLIDITVSGGSGSYTYLWSNNSISEDISNLEPGNYQVEVTDGSGCIMIEAFTISEPDPLTASFVSTSPSCYGSANGSINLSVLGGTMPYSFTWSDGSVNEDLSGLVSGTYSVSIIDAVQCELVTGIALTQPDSMSISFTASNAACSATGGIAEAFVTGGNQSYSYLWSNGVTSPINSSLSPGIYTLTVTDILSCVVTDTVTIGGTSSNISLAFTTVSTNCSDSNDGSIDLSISGGVEPYSFLWSDGSIAEDLLLVAGGNYTVTVTDANGCTQNGTVLIDSPAPLTSALNVTNLSCNVTKGIIDLEVMGGTSPYTYSWSSGETSQDLNNLDPGIFTVVYTDLNGCSGTVTAEVIQIPDLVLTAESGNVTIQGGSDGTIDLTVTGGLEPYSFDWSNGSVTEDLVNLTGGIYTVTVTDASACSATLTVEVYENVSTSLNDVTNDFQIQVIENGNGYYILGLTPANSDKYVVDIFDDAGRNVGELFNGMMEANETKNISTQDIPLSGGIYLLRISSPRNQKSLKLFIRNY